MSWYLPVGYLPPGERGILDKWLNAESSKDFEFTIDGKVVARVHRGIVLMRRKIKPSDVLPMRQWPIRAEFEPVARHLPRALYLSEPYMGPPWKMQRFRALWNELELE